MTQKIRLLHETTINQINAGEVIENSASVVKELVDNSIDAGSTEITIEIQTGGRQLIRVVDNGSGMSQDDALLCLERHATSKIRTFDDLSELSTMGFRGEAIPSIASVSKFTLLTKEEGDELGVFLQIDGGQLIKQAKAPCSKGTTIEVRSLFFNVPVRKKFLRSPTYDIQEIVKIVSQLALSHPSIRFQLVSDKITLFTTQEEKHTSFKETIKARIDTLLGVTYKEGASYVDKQAASLYLRGWIASADQSKSNRGGQILFINDRPIQSPLISKAIKEGFGPLIPDNRFPSFVLFLQMPSDYYDVNVHPQKKEVRLRYPQPLFNFVVSAIEESLIYKRPLNVFSEPSSDISWNSHSFTPDLFCKKSTSPQPEFSLATTPHIFATIKGYAFVAAHSVPFLAHLLKSPLDAVLVVDTKATSEKIFYQRVQKKDSTTAKQDLLLAKTLDLSHEEWALFQHQRSVLDLLGFEIEPFGQETILIRAIPQEIAENQIEPLIRDLLSLSKEEESLLPHLCRKISSYCHDKLSVEQTRHLIKELETTQSPHLNIRGTPLAYPLFPETVGKLFL